jgi:hypothetical protein
MYAQRAATQAPLGSQGAAAALAQEAAPPNPTGTGPHFTQLHEQNVVYDFDALGRPVPSGGAGFHDAHTATIGANPKNGRLPLPARGLSSSQFHNEHVNEWVNRTRPSHVWRQ